MLRTRVSKICRAHVSPHVRRTEKTRHTHPATRAMSVGRFASRRFVGHVEPTVLSKDSIRHTIRAADGNITEMMSLGGAASEVFSGPALARVLQPSMRLMSEAMASLQEGKPSPILSQHTSTGKPALGGVHARVMFSCACVFVARSCKCATCFTVFPYLHTTKRAPARPSPCHTARRRLILYYMARPPTHAHTYPSRAPRRTTHETHTPNLTYG